MNDVCRSRAYRVPQGLPDCGQELTGPFTRRSIITIIWQTAFTLWLTLIICRFVGTDTAFCLYRKLKHSTFWVRTGLAHYMRPRSHLIVNMLNPAAVPDKYSWGWPNGLIGCSVVICTWAWFISFPGTGPWRFCRILRIQVRGVSHTLPFRSTANWSFACSRLEREHRILTLVWYSYAVHLYVITMSDQHPKHIVASRTCSDEYVLVHKPIYRTSESTPWLRDLEIVDPGLADSRLWIFSPGSSNPSSAALMCCTPLIKKYKQTAR